MAVIGDVGASESPPSDIVALAFQELDLSTAALIYATEKSREEAWTQAVLRSLNKHSTKEEPTYTKVGLFLNESEISNKASRYRCPPSNSLACYCLCLSGRLLFRASQVYKRAV
jgi:hypothetical protein